MKITQTNGNSINKISGSRLRFWNDRNEMVVEMEVPKWNPLKYIKKYPNGKYGEEFKTCCSMVEDSNKGILA